MQLKRSKSSARASTLFIFALFWNAFSILFVVLGLVTNAGVPFALCGLLFLGIGLLIVGGAVRILMASWKVAEPDISISLPQLRVGDQFELSYRQRFKGQAKGHITLKLIFRECATYQRGTDTVTVTHGYVMHSIQLPPRNYMGGETLSELWSIQIPPSAMHSFKAKRNELLWLLQVDVDIAGWPDFERTYDLMVLPS